MNSKPLLRTPDSSIFQQEEKEKEEIRISSPRIGPLYSPESTIPAEDIINGIAVGDPDNSLLRRIKLLEDRVGALDNQITVLQEDEEDTRSLTGTHAERLATPTGPLSTGTFFYETDFTSLYVLIISGGTKTWRWVA